MRLDAKCPALGHIAHIHLAIVQAMLTRMGLLLVIGLHPLLVKRQTLT